MSKKIQKWGKETVSENIGKPSPVAKDFLDKIKRLESKYSEDAIEENLALRKEIKTMEEDQKRLLAENEKLREMVKSLAKFVAM